MNHSFGCYVCGEVYILRRSVSGREACDGGEDADGGIDCANYWRDWRLYLGRLEAVMEDEMWRRCTRVCKTSIKLVEV